MRSRARPMVGVLLVSPLRAHQETAQATGGTPRARKTTIRRGGGKWVSGSERVAWVGRGARLVDATIEATGSMAVTARWSKVEGM